MYFFFWTVYIYPTESDIIHVCETDNKQMKEKLEAIQMWFFGERCNVCPEQRGKRNKERNE